MGRFTTFFMVIMGLEVLFYFAGLIPESPLLTILLNPQNILTAGIGVKAFSVLAGVGLVAGVVIGFVTKNFELTVMIPFAVFMVGIAFDFLEVFNSFKAEAPVIAVLIFAPFLVMLVIIILDWWRGRDS